MEINLGSSDLVGEKGWLYNMTKELFSLGAKIYCTGDSPWLLRLISCLGSNVGHFRLAKLPLYVKDPDPVDVQAEEQALIPSNSKKSVYNVRIQRPKEWKSAMEKIGAILPTSVDPTTGFRTKLKFSLINQLPDFSNLTFRMSDHSIDSSAESQDLRDQSPTVDDEPGKINTP